MDDIGPLATQPKEEGDDNRIVFADIIIDFLKELLEGDNIDSKDYYNNILERITLLNVSPSMQGELNRYLHSLYRTIKDM